MSDISEISLIAFVRESNLIEGIRRSPTNAEIQATAEFLERDAVTVPALQTLVGIYAPGKPLRDRNGMDVRVGSHVAPPGGPAIITMLERLLNHAADQRADPWLVHCGYETLHPFMDGNGRSGRALWAWVMLNQGHDPFALPFLHRFYYQTLEHSR